MTNLSLRLSGVDSISGAPVYIEVINTNLETVAELPIPVNFSREIQLEPGKYLIRANLPSGKIISAKASVAENKSNKVELSLLPSPNQLDWQDFLGNTSAYTHGLTISQFGSIWQRLWSREEETWKVPEWRTEWKRPHDETAIKFPLELAQNQLQFLQIGGLQIPWHLIALPPVKDLEVLVRPSEYESDFGEDIALALTSRNNRESETLLSYLNSGNIRAAKVVGEKFIEESLRTKKSLNPLEAVIGGYYLLGVNTNKRLDEWCIKFLSQENWLPDAQLIRAWQLLREPDVPRINCARSYLLTTVKCGIPVYTQGLRLLFDGLQLFHQDALTRNEQDVEIEKALAKIRRYANAANWSKLLTTFYGHDPEHPEYSRITGKPQDTRSLVWLVEESNNVEYLKGWLEGIYRQDWLAPETVLTARRRGGNVSQEISRAKLINLGQYNLVLLVSICLEAEDKFTIQLRLYPAGGTNFLPQSVQLLLLDEEFGEIIEQEQAEQENHNFLGMELNEMEVGDIFSVQVAIGEMKITENFAI